MKNTFGNSVAITLFGESHGEYISYIRLACIKTITDHGTDGYLEAIDYLTEGK